MVKKHSNNLEGVYKNIEKYSLSKKRKILIINCFWWYDSWYD